MPELSTAAVITVRDVRGDKVIIRQWNLSPWEGTSPVGIGMSGLDLPVGPYRRWAKVEDRDRERDDWWLLFEVAVGEVGPREVWMPPWLS